MPEKPASPLEQLDWLTFNMSVGAMALEARITDALSGAEKLLHDVKVANERLTGSES